MSLLDFNLSTPWSITPEMAEVIKGVAERTNETSPQMLEAYKAAYADKGDRLKVREGVGILDVSGPLFKKANLFTSISGATSYEMLRRDLQVALDDPSIHSIILRVDSPGGEANGCDELAKAIFEARDKKQITAFVSGQACSGGYWIASAASRIVISDAAMLGSIGVVLGLQDTTGAEEARGRKTYQFVSSQSPGKRPDPKTAEGSDRIQKMVDDLATVFVSAVAVNRGVDVATVIEKFGKGGVEIGKNAVELGMADAVGSFEGAITSLISSGKQQGRIPQRFGGLTMSENTNGPTAEEIAATATANAQTRIKAITASEDGKKVPTLAAFLAFDTGVTADVAKGILAAGVADMPKIELIQGQVADLQPIQQQTQGQSFVERKTEAGALGLGKPETTGGEKPDPMAGWAKATSQANASIGVPTRQ